MKEQAEGNASAASTQASQLMELKKDLEAKENEHAELKAKVVDITEKLESGKKEQAALAEELDGLKEKGQALDA